MKTILCALAILAVAGSSSTFAVDGFCTVSGTTNWNITGGDGGPTTTVTTASAFLTAIKASGPQVVIVQGDVGSVGDTTTITSSKSILGACSGGTIHGLISVDKGSSNVIISNLTMVGGTVTSDDCLDVINGGHHVFVTHCDFSEAHDECFSITKTADYVTVSWCKFHFAAAGSHTFGDLVGSDDSILADSNKLHITWHHNWYSTNVTERMPRVRFGQNHVYNNYYGCPGNDYCVGVGFHCHIRLENAYFDGINNAWQDYSNGGGYEFGYTNNVFANGATQPTWAVNSNATIYTPPYPYTLDPAINVKDLVTRGAGVNSCGPLALFDGGPVTGAAPLTVTFHDYSTGDITNRLLNFGDTGTANITATNTVNHVYSAGTFTVSLTVSGSGGSNTFTRTNFIVATGGGGSPPTITQQPLSTNVCSDATAKFSVTASGTDPLSYQWQTNSVNLSNGGDFSGVTSNVLTVSPASASDAANYRCIVTNVSGSVTSSAPALTVNALPTQYTVGGGGSYCSGGGGVTVTLSSSQSGVTYYLQLGGSNTGATLAGTGSGLNFTGVIAAGTYGILASNTTTSCTQLMSGTVTVTVNPRPTSVVSGTATICNGDATTIQAILNGTGPWNLTWSDGTNQNGVASSPATRSVSPSATTTYTVTALSDAHCTAQAGDRTGSAVVTVTATVTPTVSVEANPGTTVCAGTAVTFTATPTNGGSSPTYLWKKNGVQVGGTGNTYSYTPADGDKIDCQLTSNLSCASPTTANAPQLTMTVQAGFEAWQLQYFGCTNCSEAAPDADPLGKGMSNSNQFLAGFDPTNNAAYLRIISILNSNNDVVLTYLGANGDTSYPCGPTTRTNVLESTAGAGAQGNYTNNFVSTGLTNILSDGTGLGVVTNMVDVGGVTNGPAHYYRVRVVP